PLSLAYCHFSALLPPAAPLFPYTTLFRSVCIFSVGRLPRRFARGSSFGKSSGERRCRVAERRADSHDAAGIVQGSKIRSRFDARDRKSTRLNSSHGSISYAVFCLKNKNKD